METTEKDEIIHETEVIRCPGCTELMDSLDGMRTVQEVFKYALKKYPDKEIGARPRDPVTDKPIGDFKFIDFREFARRVGKFGRGLTKLFDELNPDFASRPVEVPEDTMKIIGLYSINRIEWSIGDMACANYGFVSVPLYDTLGPDAVMKIIIETRLQIAFCSKDKAAKLVDMAEKIPTLKVIIQMDGPCKDKAAEEETERKAKEAGIRIITYDDVLKSGELNTTEDKAAKEGEEDPLAGCVDVKPDDFHTIIYTSGTSGGAKGVILKNKSFVAGVAGTIYPLRFLLVPRGEIFLSFLPLAHVLERQVFIITLYYGVRVGYFSGHISGLLDDIQKLHPTVFFGVPRLFNKIYAGFQEKLAEKSWFVRKIFETAYAWKASWIENTPPGQTPPWTTWLDPVFSQIRGLMGGNLKIIITGSAPLAPEIHRFLQVCCSCPVVVGYGMSEAYPVAVTTPEDPEPLNCGPLMPHCEMKLRDCPALGYHVADKPCPRGEALIRGNQVFAGYYRNPEVTARAMTKDGWYCTGDIIELLPGNRIRMVGRCKEIIKLAQGEFVPIEDVESMYALCPYVGAIFVYGDHTREFLVAVVVPEEAEIRKWWCDSGHTPKDIAFKDLCASPDVKKEIFAALMKQHAASGMTGINRLHAIHIESEPFSTTNGLLTPTNKLSREKVKKYYADVIKTLYENESKK